MSMSQWVHRVLRATYADAKLLMISIHAKGMHFSLLYRQDALP